MRGTKNGPHAPNACSQQDWIWTAADCPPSHDPQHVHLILGPSPNSMFVTWATYDNSTLNVVYYREISKPQAQELKQLAFQTRYFNKKVVDGVVLYDNSAGLHFHHSALLSDLTHDADYEYRVCSKTFSYGIAPKQRCSKTFSFHVLPSIQQINSKPPQQLRIYQNAQDRALPTPFSLPPDGLERPDSPFTLLVFGDIGRHGGEPILPFVQEEIRSNRIAAMLAMGDFAYDMFDQQGLNADTFMSRIQSIAAHVPFQICPGNHEIEDNATFAQYQNRFVWPAPFASTTENGIDVLPMFYSFDIGLIHFISFNSEYQYIPNLSNAKRQMELQRQWLISDLASANKNRGERPWIIAFTHRPMYCSNIDRDECYFPETNAIRLDLEQLFFQFGVDVILEAHEHSYETTWPVINMTVTNFDYINPKAPVHIITGTAGCNEQGGTCVNPIWGPRGDWSRFRASGKDMYGYGHLIAVNATHLYWDQVEVVRGTTVDAFYIVQEQHGMR